MKKAPSHICPPGLIFELLANTPLNLLSECVVAKEFHDPRRGVIRIDVPPSVDVGDHRRSFAESIVGTAASARSPYFLDAIQSARHAHGRNLVMVLHRGILLARDNQH